MPREPESSWYELPSMIYIKQSDFSLLYGNNFTNNTSCGGPVNETGHHEFFPASYGGIPETLTLNVIGWLIILFLFAILRKRAWNYGRIALVHKSDEKWTQLFYGTTEELTGVSEADSLNSVDSNIDKGFCSWMAAIFYTSDESFMLKCGPDAVQYLKFQRHILFYMTLVMIVSVGVVLPVNFQGNQDGDESSFGHTTLHNLSPNSSLLWLHVTLAILYLPLGIVVMRRFSNQIKFEDADTVVSRTLMVSNVPRKHCDAADLHRHFREAYEDMEVQDIQLAYNIAKVSELESQRDSMFKAKVYCEEHFKDNGTRLDMRPYLCGNICGCCNLCGCPMVDAIEYYSAEESRLRTELERERITALKHPLGIVFVTLATLEAAKKVFSDHRPSYKCLHNPPTSTLSRQLQPSQWRVNFAPSPKDIYWENLRPESSCWYLRAFFINFILFIFLFFLTTPALVVNMFFKITTTDELQKVSPLLSDFLPTLLLWTVAALMPVVVSYSDQWVSHWTRSEQNYTIMIKTLTLLLFMVLILPSLGLTSVQAFLEWTWHGHSDEKYRWDCLFLPDKGAFFINYVITSAFIGTGLELVRFPELFIFALKLALARSPAETASVRKSILREFQFGVQYAWMMLIFAMTITYSLSCPLITPFGVVYMVLKHVVDRYNIYFAYAPSKISSQIHATAINAVIVSITMLQLSFTALAVLREGFNNIAVFSFIGLCITCAFLFAQITLQSCKGFSPISYQIHSPSSSVLTSPRRSTSTQQFLPVVLQPTSPFRAAPLVSVRNPAEGLSALQRTYGTHDDVSPEAAIAFEPSTRDRTQLYQDYDGSNAEV